MDENPPSHGGGPGSATAPAAFRARSGSSAGRALMLTVAALRAIRNAGYPHGRESAEQQREPGSATAAGIPCQKRLIGRSSADAHRRNTQCRKSFRLPDIHTGARAIFAHMLTCEPDVHDASGDVGLGLGGRMIAFWCADRLSRVDARLCGHVESLANAAMRGKIGALQTIPPRSPLECTALRVAADAGISTSRRIRDSATMRAFG
ncbi:hypothetical protein [Burkholderia cepacia]|uniref:hypothetical protein n=1 Tax=Burkholderia cepacia TaxID=292 RepID=UPI000F594E47|nr:hypothetical protein [Burkholderia cepacia]